VNHGAGLGQGKSGKRIAFGFIRQNRPTAQQRLRGKGPANQGCKFTSAQIHPDFLLFSEGKVDYDWWWNEIWGKLNQAN
jgi:hypothetical protein